MTNPIATQREKVLKSAEAILARYEGKAMPPNEARQIEVLLGQADVLQATLDAQSGVKAANATWRPAAPSEGNVKYDAAAWREVEVKTPFGTQKRRFNVPLATEAKGYGPAFEAYLRFGVQHVREALPRDYKTLTEGTDTAGGFLVPPDFQTEVIRKMAALAVMRGLCKVVTTSRDVMTWPRVKYSTATDDSTGNIYTSPVRMTWTGESPASSTTHRVTDPVLGQINIPVNTAMASLPLSNNLMEDAAADVTGLASDLMAEAFGLGEDYTFLLGSGISQPYGLITNVDGTDQIASSISGATTSPFYTFGGLLNLEAAFPAQYERGAVWLGNKATFNFLRQVTTASPTIPVWNGIMNGALDAMPATLLNYPIYKSEFMPASTGSGNFPLVLGDFSGYLIVDRVGMSVQRLSELYAETNVTVLLARHRVGGQVVEPYKFRAAKIST
jgi:HK97 family phage major capsid protein